MLMIHIEIVTIPAVSHIKAINRSYNSFIEQFKLNTGTHRHILFRWMAKLWAGVFFSFCVLFFRTAYDSVRNISFHVRA